MEKKVMEKQGKMKAELIRQKNDERARRNTEERKNRGTKDMGQAGKNMMTNKE